MSNQSYDLPQNLGDLMGVYDTAHWQTAVLELKTGIGVVKRGTILASGTGADVGKLVKLTAGTEAQAYGVLLDPSIDTSAPFSDGTVTGSIAKAGSFKGSALIVPAGIDPGLVSVALRGRDTKKARRGDQARAEEGENRRKAKTATEAKRRARKK